MRALPVCSGVATSQATEPLYERVMVIMQAWRSGRSREVDVMMQNDGCGEELSMRTRLDSNTNSRFPEEQHFCFGIRNEISNID